MLTQLDFENFRPFGKPVSLRIKPITILTGPNNSGKSSILHLLRYTGAGITREMDRINTSQEILGETRNAFTNNPNFTYRIYAELPGMPEELRYGIRVVIAHTDGETFPARAFALDARTGQETSWDCTGHPPGHPTDPISAQPPALLQDTIVNTIGNDLLGLRTIVQDRTGADFQKPLAEIMKSDPSALEFIMKHLEPLTGIRNLRAGPEGETQDGAGTTDQDGIPLAAQGMGARQTLHLLTRAATAAPGSTIMLEQPENGLDPTRQLSMGSMLADLWTSRQVRSIIETHSDNLLLRIRRMAADGRLDHRDLSIAFCVRDEDNQPGIRNIDLNGDGSLGPGLPMSFFGANVIEALEMNAADRRESPGPTRRTG